MATPRSILDKVGKDLHNVPDHPIEIVKNKIIEYFMSQDAEFKVFDKLPHIVNVADNFDALLIPLDHPSRSKHDTYYIDDEHCLRTHTSAHQRELLEAGERKFLVPGSVYRKDEVNRTHYPVFHQIEGVYCAEDATIDHLKATLAGLCKHLFPDNEMQFADDYFPFTHPSFEANVKFGDTWLEILGCGMIQPKIFNGPSWAFGIGLERIAMIMFGIPDIRYFWTQDQKFLSQFKNGQDTKFKEYSRLEQVIRDISFWQKEGWNENEFMEIVRSDLVSDVRCIDTYRRGERISTVYRVTYQPIDSNMTNPAEFDRLVDEIHNGMLTNVRKLPLMLR